MRVVSYQDRIWKGGVEMRLPRLKVRRTDNWIEVYVPKTDGYEYSYCLGFIDKDGKGIITDVWIDKRLRRAGLGSKMVKLWIKTAKAKPVYPVMTKDEVRAHNIQPEAEGFWERKGIEEIPGRSWNRVQRKRDQFLEEEYSTDS